MATGIGGFGFVEILFREVSMIIGALIFLFCGAVLIFKRKALSTSQKGFAVTALIVTGLYLAFILWLVINWGGNHP